MFPSLAKNKIKHNKKHIADVITLRTLRLGDYPGLSGWSLNVIASVLIRGKHRQTLEVEVGVMPFEGRERGQKPRNTGGH